jgi:hypothetical protein
MKALFDEKMANFTCDKLSTNFPDPPADVVSLIEIYPFFALNRCDKTDSRR